MTKRNAVLWLVVVAALVAIVVVFRNKVQFDWSMFMRQLRFVSVRHVVAGILLIYLAYVVRAARWSVFLAPTKKVSTGSLIGSQYIGFAAVALFGRLADLTRPYLVARRVGLSLSSQIAVYTIERMFDLGAAAIIFSSALAFTPKDLPHHEIFVRAGVVSLAVTSGDCGVRWCGAGSWWGGGEVCACRAAAAIEAGGGEHFVEDHRVSRWLECDRIEARLWAGGGAVARDVGDDWRGIPAGAALVYEYAGAGDAVVLADDAADGGKYWRVADSASDYWVVYADCCFGCGDACVLWGSD